MGDAATMAPELASLRAGALRLDLWPDLGGSVVAFHHGGISLGQPLPDDWASARNASKLSNFALGPWFNRIPEGRFSFEGHDYTVPMDRPDLRAATHGFVRHRAPHTRQITATTARFVDDYDDPRSPWRYRSELDYALDGDGLTAQLVLTNTGRRMPFGVGFHPFFRRTPAMTLSVAADGYLRNDAGSLPESWQPVSDHPALARGAGCADLIGLNNSFTGWRQPAVIRWPDLGLAAHVTAQSSQKLLLHLFAPPDREILCVEPVTNVADVINRRALAPHGDMTVLDEGQCVSLRLRIDIAALG